MKPRTVLYSMVLLLSSAAAGAMAHARPSFLLLKVPFYPDRSNQCGPSTLASLLSFWGHPTNPKEIREELYLPALHGTLPIDLLLAAQSHGLDVQMVRGDLDELHGQLLAGRPVLAMLNRGLSFAPIDHYVVVIGYDDARQGLYMHSGRYENEFIPYKRFVRMWKKTDYWTMQARAR